MNFLKLVPILALLVFAPSALAATTTERVPFQNLPFTNPCNGEDFTVSGSYNHVVSTTTSSTGRIHVVIHYNFQGVSGTAASGARYVVPSSNTLVQEADFDGTPSSSRFEARQRFVRVGNDGSDDLSIRFVLVVVVDANGEVHEQNELSLVCH